MRLEGEASKEQILDKGDIQKQYKTKKGEEHLPLSQKK